MRKIGRLRKLLGESGWTKYQRIRENEKASRWQFKNGDKVVRWRQRLKERLIEYKGGKCEKCGYDKKVPSAYAFHHRDPSQKEFAISSDGNTRSFERCKTEVDKCDLLCVRCHAEFHNGEYEQSKQRTIRDFEANVEKWSKAKDELLREYLGDAAEPFIKEESTIGGCLGVNAGSFVI